MPIIEMGPGRFYDTFTGKMYSSQEEAEKAAPPSVIGGETKDGYEYTYYSDGSVSRAKQGEGLGGFLEKAIPELAYTAAAFVPATAPYVRAYEAAKAADEGDWGRALVLATSAAAPIAGGLGAEASTVSSLNEASKYAKILKALDDKQFLNAAFSGADLAGISDAAGFDLSDVKKAVNFGMALKSENPLAIVQAGSAFAPKGGEYSLDPSMIEEGSFKYPDYFDPTTAGLVDLLGPSADGYQFTTDFGVNADYTLGPKGDGLGLATTSVPDAFDSEGNVNYDLFNYGELPGEGFRMPTDRNLESMGGGQGITGGGEKPTFDLGEPGSFINQPAPGGDVSDAVQKALDAGAKETYKDLTQKKTTAQQGGVDLLSLMSLLGAQQPQPTPLTVPENAADIKLMEDIFGTSLSAPSTGREQDKADALARLLRS